MDFNTMTGNETLSLDDITGGFQTRTQRQDYYEPQPSADAPDDLDPSLVNPYPDDDIEEPETTEIPPDVAEKSGMTMARVIDTGVSFALSSFVAHNDKDYKASEADLEFAGELWGQIQMKRGWTMGPEGQLAMLYAIIYGPLVKEAMNDRRIAELQKKQMELENRIRNIENERPPIHIYSDHREPEPAATPTAAAEEAQP